MTKAAVSRALRLQATRVSRRVRPGVRPRVLAPVTGSTADLLNIERALLSDKRFANLSGPARRAAQRQARASAIEIQRGTQKRIRTALDQGKARGETPAQVRRRVRRSLSTPGRAEVITRTERSRVAGAAMGAELKAEGVRYVRITDGDRDAPCAAANGSIWSVEFYESHLLEHPNCQRNATPHRGKP